MQEVQQADRQISESFAGMEQAGQAHQAEVTANLAQQAQASAKLLAIAQETSTQVWRGSPCIPSLDDLLRGRMR